MSGHSAPSGFRCRSHGTDRLCVATAARAARGDMARHVLEEIQARLALRPDLEFRLETALHEAIANVTLHGTLEVPGFDRTSLASLLAQQQRLTERLSDPRYAGREVEVTSSIADDRIEIEISGPGPGFDIARAQDRSAPEASTRGLSLIANLSDLVRYRDGGRTVVLVFFLRRGASANDPAPKNSCGGQG